MTFQRTLDLSLLLVDLSGFTQLLYHAEKVPQVGEVVDKTLALLFGKSSKAASHRADSFVINTTGDGFFVGVTGKTPSRTALDLATTYQRIFHSNVRSVIGQVPFRCRVDLRVALHHGTIAWQDVPALSAVGASPRIYYGDALNLVARLIDSRTARDGGIAVSRELYRRVRRTSDRKLPPPAEVMIDRNKYPEPLEVFRGDELLPLLTQAAGDVRGSSKET